MWTNPVWSGNSNGCNAYTAFDKAPGAAEETDRLLREAEQDAASKGVVGIRDYEMAENIDTWINRFAAGINGLRVDAGVYPERLRAAIDVVGIPARNCRRAGLAMWAP